jgi:hypothetical protein
VSRLGSWTARIATAAVVGLIAAPLAAAREYIPPGNHIFAGLTGGKSILPYQHMVGKHPAVFEDYLTYNTPSYWIGAPRRSFRSRLGLELSTSKGYNLRGLITPRGIAFGGSDRFLVALNRNLFKSRRIFYVRIMGEPDGWWNAYAAFNADGSFRGSQNSPTSYIQAWRRSVIVLRGGPVAGINRRLRRLGLPALRTRNKRLPRPKVAFLWVPQDAGSPEIAANMPASFWPGSAYVDWIGTDFYSSYPNFSLLSHFYNQFGGKPFVFSEWGVSDDDPGFVHQLFAWVASHPRVRMINFYQGYGSSNPYDLKHYPATQRALRAELHSKRFLGYPPEYAHPKRQKRPTPPPETPPVNPQPAPPPSPPPVALPPPTPAPPVSPPPGLCIPLINVCLPL